MAAASGEAMDALDDLEALQDLAELSASASFSSDNSPPALPDAAVAGPSAEPEPEPEPLGRTPSAEEREAARRAVCQRLQETPFLAHTHERFMHGRGYEGPATLPKATWVSTKKPRDDHDCPSWLKATEFADSPNVALAKAKQLAALLRAARRTVCSCTPARGSRGRLYWICSGGHFPECQLHTPSPPPIARATPLSEQR